MTLKQIGFAWNHRRAVWNNRRALWKYRKLIYRRKEIAAADPSRQIAPGYTFWMRVR